MMAFVGNLQLTTGVGFSGKQVCVKKVSDLYQIRYENRFCRLNLSNHVSLDMKVDPHPWYIMFNYDHIASFKEQELIEAGLPPRSELTLVPILSDDSKEGFYNQISSGIWILKSNNSENPFRITYSNTNFIVCFESESDATRYSQKLQTQNKFLPIKESDTSSLESTAFQLNSKLVLILSGNDIEPPSVSPSQTSTQDQGESPSA